MTKLLIERKACTRWTSQQVSDGVEKLHHSQSIKEKHDSWRAPVLHSWCPRPFDSSPFGQTKIKNLLHKTQRMESIICVFFLEKKWWKKWKASKICRYYRYRHSTPTFPPPHSEAICCSPELQHKDTDPNCWIHFGTALANLFDSVKP